MKYLISSQIEDDFIADIVNIDNIVYDQSARGNELSLHARYNANRESYILAYDDSRLIGYVAFFPITENLRERMEYENEPFDDNIRAIDILPSYSSDIAFDMFLISIAVLPEYSNKGIGTKLLNQYFQFVSSKVKMGCLIRSTYIYAYTDAGLRFFAENGFSKIKSVMHQESGQIVQFMKHDSFKLTD